jgi:hypothetical protein
MLFAAKVWTYWISVSVILLVVVATLATIAGYLIKVVKPKYPPRGR